MYEKMSLHIRVQRGVQLVEGRERGGVQFVSERMNALGDALGNLFETTRNAGCERLYFLVSGVQG